MQSFRIRPDGFKEIRKRMLIIMISILVVVGTITTVTSASTSILTNDASYQFVWSQELILPLAIIVASFGVALFSMYRFFSRIKKVYESYELTISDNLIAREQENTPTISIYLNDVQEIVKRKYGSYIIRGTKANDLIIVPKQIENPELLELALEQIKPIATKGKGASQLNFQALISFVTLGLMYCVFVFDNKIIVAIAGTLFVALYIWGFIQTQKSKNVDYRTKRIRWVKLLALLIVIYFIITKLTGSALF